MRSKVYLAGPIHGRTDAQCKAWRTEAASILGVHDVQCMDPMEHDYRGIEDEFAEELVARDKEWIEECDVVLVNASEPSWGTAMEVLYAESVGSQVVAFTDAESISPWLRVHAIAIFGTLAQALEGILFGQSAGMR